MPEIDEEDQVELWGEAQAVLGINAEALRIMAVFAWNHRRSRRAMSTITSAWGRNARLLATAVARWPQYFMGRDDAPDPIPLEPDELLALFEMARLPLKPSHALHTKWRRYTWPAWRIKQEVEAWRDQQRDPQLLRLRTTRARVAAMQTLQGADGEVHQATIRWQGDRPVSRWAGRTVELVLTERKQ